MDYNLIFKIAGIGLITAIVAQILKNVGKEEIATVATLAGLVVVLLMAVNMVSDLFETVKRLFLLY
ncbi:MAG: stage III sporulation protein AC [Christensenellales bacterium]